MFRSVLMIVSVPLLVFGLGCGQNPDAGDGTGEASAAIAAAQTAGIGKERHGTMAQKRLFCNYQ